MSDEFFDIIKDIELDEIIDIFKNHIIAESKENSNTYIKFIDFKYPAYFVKRFGSKSITNKIYEFILMNTKRRVINLEDKKLNYLELVIFYEEYYKENIIKIVDVSNDNIIGLLFPIINRKNMNHIQKRNTMGLFNVIETYEENEDFGAKGIYYNENGDKDYEGDFKDYKCIYKCKWIEEQCKKHGHEYMEDDKCNICKYVEKLEQDAIKYKHLKELKRQELQYQHFNQMMNEEKDKFNKIKESLTLTSSEEDNTDIEDSEDNTDNKNNTECEENKDHHSNGKLWRHYYIKNGQKQGDYKQYHTNGTLYIECHYVNDKYNGEYIEYYESGSIHIKCNFNTSGRLDGDHLEYDEQENLMIVSKYVDGDLREIKKVNNNIL